MYKPILIIFILFMISCAPLRKVAKQEFRDSLVIDNSTIHRVITDHLKSEEIIRQIEVEFYPLTMINSKELPDSTVLERPVKVFPIKRIAQTEIIHQAEQNLINDSLAKVDIILNKTTHIDEKLNEKPSSQTIAVKWLVVGLFIVLIIYIIKKII